MSESFFKSKTLGLFVKTNGVISKHFFAGKGFIVCLHRILPKKMHDPFWGENSMAVSPEYLEWMIKFVRSEGFEWISVDEVAERLSRPKSKPFACITLDDGWKDNLTYGFPVFQKHGVPFCIYVANCFPNATSLKWTESLTRLVETGSRISFTYKGKSFLFTLSSQGEKKNAYNQIRLFVLDAGTLEEMNNRIGVIFEGFSSIPLSEALSWDEVIALAGHELCTIGAHTMHHVPLAKFSDEDVLYEMRESKAQLEDRIQKQVNHFAYPYGSKNECSNREFNLAAKAGFKMAVTGRPANVFSGNINNLMAVPRYAIGEATNEDRLRYITNGVLHFSLNGFKQIVTD